ncbi:GNAT family N-acetyltransferase [candidate division WOR-3 bacterium]|nr:GNAT family N-acetyltransferase [candidate division WOR-3 bacterium]
MENLALTEANEEDIDFLLEMWNDPRMMRYAGYPEGRCWSDADIRRWWQGYLAERRRSGNEEPQLILHLEDGTAIGESHYGPVPDGFEVGEWRKPEGVKCLMTDIKLLSRYWGRGIGTQGMRMIVELIFAKTSCELLVVPPHRDNPPAFRVYEKAGFLLTGIEAWQGYEMMELARERFNKLYR